MNLSNKAGFTVIETILFLGITCLLIVGVLAGTGSSVNTQKYHDSVYSFQSILQKQYTEVTNVSNASIENTCYGDSKNNVEHPRGQSDCVIIGKYITTAENGHALLIRQVLGYTPNFSTSQLDDVAIFGKMGYNINLSPDEGSKYVLEWEAALTDDKESGGKPSKFSMLVLRSPASGVIRTFAVIGEEVASSKLQSSLLNISAMKKPIKTCVEPNGIFVNGASVGGKMSVSVSANASGVSGVEILGDAISGC